MSATRIDPYFVQKYRNKGVPWGPVGYVTYKRTYARRINDSTQTEEWFETLERVCNGLLKIGAIYTQEEIQELYDIMFNLEGVVSGRALWQLGTTTVDKIGADSLINCWCVAINNLEAFEFMFNELMLGGGVGFSILPEHVYQLPTVKFKPRIIRNDVHDVDFIVPDNREGWVELLHRIFQAVFYTGKDLIYSTDCIRSKGAPIQGFGGTASGPEDLVKGLNEIINVLSSRLGQKLRPIDALDICNIIGAIVVAGNVRRSAELSLGDSTDLDYMYAKNWKAGIIPSWRSMSNNSIEATDFERISETFWNGYNGDGEPYGLINLYNHRNYGRLIDGLKIAMDAKVVGINPCSEISLENFECCNLAEIFLPNIRDLEHFKKVARLLYMAQKSISAMQYSHPRTQEVVSRNHRLGLGITGYLQSKFQGDSSTFDSVYRYIRDFDGYYSEILGVQPSIKLTTVKPSGTLSLLPGVTPGGHPAFAPFYIRRIRFASADPIVQMCRESGLIVEPVIQLDGKQNFDTMVVSFPVKSHEDAVCNYEITAIDQLETLKFLQTWWSDNSVSVTIYYKSEELPLIKKWLSDNYNTEIKSVSFLLHSGHGFVQAPYEEITPEKYDEMLNLLKPLGKIGEGFSDLTSDNLECVSGICPVR